jgi:hypothetical protein
VLSYKTALINVGWNGKILANLMPWVGEPGHIHRCTSYSSLDPGVISRQADNMQAVGVDGIILTWRGIDANKGWDQHVATAWIPELTKRGMLFSYMPDPNLLKYRHYPALSDTEEMIRQLKSPGVLAILKSPVYLPEGYIFDFLTGFSVDWLKVEATINPLLGGRKIQHLMRHKGYEWPSLEGVGSANSNHKSSLMKVPGIAYGFNDAGCPLPYGVKDPTLVTGRDYSQSAWQSVDPIANPTKAQPARVNDPQAGKYFLDVIQGIGASTTARTSSYAGIVTWNDYDEGTAIESFVVGLTGIRIGN